ncbi:mycothiol conjugate amidase Mca [Brevibacterium sp. UMB1308A]|uniref:mycothiol conjugate amidase Mca n=1 Tax=Brevibacterium sp. UMB1308A TaxID=3050608 RepID=UPI00254B6325|nr:mycothiol conjugate amidase Mca [Brevibacterium sp. UMB1308A]MDK8345775.1 mycothiol conjugate amidase Mca [Brevibacterium sp. UMB1308B]MDK8712771.1 mycothiol conjugate amidase Mca [Brevibacterium sp. UMB1308A]
MYSALRMLAVHAHPDDESSKGAATTALYTSLGAQVLIATMTGGEAGDILNPALADSPAAERDIAELRRREMATAASILGADHQWVGFVDSGLPDGDFETQVPHGCFYRVPAHVAARPLVNIIRRFKPHVITTYDELGGYPHPDHIHTHTVTMAAIQAAADPTEHPELGEPWNVQKVYYNQDLSPAKWMRVHALLEEKGLESPLAGMVKKYKERPARETWLTARIESQEFMDTARRALLAHATQIDPNGGFFSDIRKLASEYWPTEEFELAVDNTGRGLDPRADFVESDLFAGVTLEDGTVIGEDELKQACAQRSGEQS